MTAPTKWLGKSVLRNEDSRFLTGRNRPAGPWGRGGPIAGPQGVYVQTADGIRDPAGGIFGGRPRLH